MANAQLCPLTLLPVFNLKNIFLSTPSYPCIVLKTPIWSQALSQDFQGGGGSRDVSKAAFWCGGSRCCIVNGDTKKNMPLVACTHGSTRFRRLNLVFMIVFETLHPLLKNQGEGGHDVYGVGFTKRGVRATCIDPLWFFSLLSYIQLQTVFVTSCLQHTSNTLGRVQRKTAWRRR